MGEYNESLKVRLGITAADSTAITIFTDSTASGSITPHFFATLRTYCTTYSSGNFTYTLTWTENGGARTLATASQTGANVSVLANGVIHPDAGTAVTIQLSSATSGVANLLVALDQF